jgi:hypothetical protein
LSWATAGAENPHSIVSTTNIISFFMEFIPFFVPSSLCDRIFLNVVKKPNNIDFIANISELSSVCFRLNSRMNLMYEDRINSD